MIKILILSICFSASATSYNPKLGSDRYFLNQKYAKHRFVEFVELWGKHFNIPIDLIQSVIYQESRFNHRAVSSVGALGLMQVMPNTAKYLGMSEKENLFNPYTNIYYGVKYLKYLYGKFDNWPDSLAAYYAGPSRVYQIYQGKIGTSLYRDIKEYQYRIMVNRVRFIDWSVEGDDYE